MASAFAMAPARFSGSGSVHRFFDDFNRFARFMKWNNERKLDALPLCLSGIARDAFDALSDEQKQSYEAAEAGMKSSFTSRSSVDYYAALRELKYDGSSPLDAFVIELKQLISRAYPGAQPDELLLNSFLSALSDELYSEVVGAGVDSFQNAVTKVRNLLMAVRHTSRPAVRQMWAAGSGTPAPAAPAPPAAPVTDPAIAHLERRIAQLETELSRSGPRRGSTDPSRETRSCYSCMEPGHLRRSCQYRTAICSFCNRRGHIARACRQQAKNENGPTPMGAADGSGPQNRATQ